MRRLGPGALNRLNLHIGSAIGQTGLYPLACLHIRNARNRTAGIILQPSVTASQHQLWVQSAEVHPQVC